MIRLENDEHTYLIGCTRFNTDTLQINYEYRQRHDVPVIYGTSLLIREKYPLYAITFVFEMNNTLNRIEGIGRIQNHASLRSWKRIYKDPVYSEYNAYFYVGRKWIGRETIFNRDSELLTIFERMLFTGKSHLKRQAGITIITETLMLRWLEEGTTTAKAHQGLVRLLKRIMRLFE